jgi:ferredoxin
MPIVKFVKENKEIEVSPGANLRREAMKAGVCLNKGVLGFCQGFFAYANCHGLGACGTCAVLITKGMENTNPMTLMEKLRLKSPIPLPVPDPLPGMAYLSHENTMRLACQVRVQGDIEVESGPAVDLFGENFFS